MTYVGSPHAGYLDVDRVELAESEDEVTVTLFLGNDPELDGWVTLVAVEKTVTVRLSAPLAGRTVVDGALEPPAEPRR